MSVPGLTTGGGEGQQMVLSLLILGSGLAEVFLSMTIFRECYSGLSGDALDAHRPIADESLKPGHRPWTLIELWVDRVRELPPETCAGGLVALDGSDPSAHLANSYGHHLSIITREFATNAQRSELSCLSVSASRPSRGVISVKH